VLRARRELARLQRLRAGRERGARRAGELQPVVRELREREDVAERPRLRLGELPVVREELHEHRGDAGVGREAREVVRRRRRVGRRGDRDEEVVDGQARVQGVGGERVQQLVELLP
jgi:hypothetical protein